MELATNGRVFFEPASHSYLLDEERLLIGVTELMRKHNLGADYGGIPDAVLKKAAEKGTKVHQYLQAFDEGELVPTSDLLDDYRAQGFRHICSEYLVSDNEIVATSIDKVYEAGKELVDLADVKTTQKVHRRALEWQLGIGKVLFERQNPGKKVRNCFCIWADKDGLKLKGIIPIEPVPESEVDALLDAERNGLIYIDESAVPEANLVLSDEDIAAYISKQEDIAALKAKMDEIQAGLKFYDEQLLAYMNENNLEELAAPGGVFKRKAAYTRTTIDAARLKKVYPQIAEQFSKTTEVAASLTFKTNK